MRQKVSKKILKVEKNLCLAIIASQFNKEICEGLIRGAKKILKENQIVFDTFCVPGAFEIPLMAQKCARSKKYRGVVCLGAVIRGETPHFDYVCRAVTDGLVRVSLDEGKPVGFGVITTNNVDEARARSADDENNKGRETVLAVLEMLEVLNGQST